MQRAYLLLLLSFLLTRVAADDQLTGRVIGTVALGQDLT